jgi:DNA replication protein DnaC
MELVVYLKEYIYEYKSPCWFKGNCNIESKDNCGSGCSRYSEMHYLLNTSNIPDGMIEPNMLYPEEIDYEAFKTLASIKEDIENFVDKGNFLYLWGENCGSGKSSWVIKMLKTYLALKHIGNNFKDIAWFEYVPTFMLLAKEFKSKDREEHIEALMSRDLVILDDIGCVATSKYDYSILISVIDSRYSNNKSTLFTSNLSPKDLESALDARLADRILSGYEVRIQGASRRGKGNIYIPSGGKT